MYSLNVCYKSCSVRHSGWLALILHLNLCLFAHLLEDEGPGATTEPLAIEVVQTTVDSRQVAGPHMLAGIHSESSHAHVNQLVHVVGHFAPDIILLQSKVQQTNQTAVTHLQDQPDMLIPMLPALKYFLVKFH